MHECEKNEKLENIHTSMVHYIFLLGLSWSQFRTEPKHKQEKKQFEANG